MENPLGVQSIQNRVHLAANLSHRGLYMQNTASRIIMHPIGKMAFLICKFPFIGERIIRVLWSKSASLTYLLRFMFKRKKQFQTIKEVKNEWHRLLSLFGIYPTVVKEGENEYYWTMDACPYGLNKFAEKKTCDAIMDFDRTYNKLLGAKLVILDCIPNGAKCCRYVTYLE